MITIKATTDIQLPPLIQRQSTYTEWNRSIVEVITAGLQVNYNYTLIITIEQEDFNIEVSTAVNFSTSFNARHKKMIINSA